MTLFAGPDGNANAKICSCFLVSIQLTPGGIQELASFDTADGLYDCAWSEVLIPTRMSQTIPILIEILINLEASHTTLCPHSVAWQLPVPISHRQFCESLPPEFSPQSSSFYKSASDKSTVCVFHTNDYD